MKQTPDFNKGQIVNKEFLGAMGYTFARELFRNHEVFIKKKRNVIAKLIKSFPETRNNLYEIIEEY